MVNPSYINLSAGGWGIAMGRYWLFQSLASWYLLVSF